MITLPELLALAEQPPSQPHPYISISPDVVAALVRVAIAAQMSRKRDFATDAALAKLDAATGRIVSERKPRGEGWDYSIPDFTNWRCPYCNPDGMNRTGLRPVAHMGLATNTAYAVPCEYCVNGLLPEIAQELGL